MLGFGDVVHDFLVERLDRLFVRLAGEDHTDERLCTIRVVGRLGGRHQVVQLYRVPGMEFDAMANA